VSLCGGSANLELKGGDEVVAPCGSVGITALKGMVLIQYVAADSSTAITSLGEGNSLVFEPTTFNFTAPPTNPEPVVIVVQDKEYSIIPGESFMVVKIDIKPGSFPNCFNLNQKGVIPVAILGSSILNTEAIDVSSLSLQGVKFKLVGKKSPQYLAHYEDIDGDSDLDLVIQFEDSDGYVK